MQPQLVVDHREHAILNHESIKKMDPRVIAMEIGDISIQIGSETDLMFERKTIEDLYASIIDGRFKEQKQRSSSHRIVYIIEGTHSYRNDTSQKEKMITGCVINTMIRDRIPLVHTKDLEDTVEFIRCLYSRVCKDPEKYIVGKPNNDTYIHTLAPSIKKRENVDPKTCFILQLACIPGISTKKAQTITETLTDITSMAQFCALVTKAKESGQKPEVFFKNVAGIGKGLANTIYEFCGL